MSRVVLFLAVMLSVPASLVSAQLSGVTLVEIDGPGGNRNTQEVRFGFNAADCEDPSNAVATFSVVGAAGMELEIWHNNGNSGDTCEPEIQRSSNLTERKCVLADRVSVTNMQIEVPLSLLLSADPVTSVASTICEMANAQTFTLLFVIGNNVTGPLPAGTYAAAQVVIDSQAPAAPTVATGEYSGTEIEVSWTAPTNNDVTANSMIGYSYEWQTGTDLCNGVPTDSGTSMILDSGTMDSATSDASMTDSGELDAAELDSGEPDAGDTDGGELDAATSDADTGDAGVGGSSMALSGETNSGDLSATVNLGASNSEAQEEGSTTCFVVRAIDTAGNPGPYSSAVTLTRRTGGGFCDVAEGGCPSGCSAANHSTETSGLAALVLLTVLRLPRKRT